MCLRWTLVLMCNVCFLAVTANYIVFQHHYVSRDNAQFCCNKYGMALLSLKTEEVSDVIENFLKTLPGFDKIWLGLFHNSAGQPSPGNYFWPDGEHPTWTNWDNDTYNALSNNQSFPNNSSLCIKGELVNSGLKWVVTGCEEKIQYACAVNVNTTVVTTPSFNEDDCPHLLKMTGRQFSRTGTVIENGIAKAGTYGYFKVHDKIYSMGTQIASYFTDYNHDCALKCVNHELCDEVIIVSQKLCILYQSV